MLEIQKSIKKIIEKFIAKMIPLTADVSAGSNTVSVQSTRRYIPGDELVIRDRNSSEGEFCKILSIPNHTTMVFCDNLTQSYDAENAIIQKIIGYQSGTYDKDNNPEVDFLKGIYIGDPDPIPMYPAIVIDAKSRSSEWLTLESTKEKYEIDITVYIDGSSHYEVQYELMQYYVQTIERALFRSLYPLVRPYSTTSFAEPVVAGDEVVKVEDEDFFVCGMGWVFFESVDWLIPNRFEEHLGNGVMRLVRPIEKDFAVGDIVIRPQRHIFNSLPRSTRYGTINKGGGMLKASVISVEFHEEVRRFNTYIDPLTF